MTMNNQHVQLYLPWGDLHTPPRGAGAMDAVLATEGARQRALVSSLSREELERVVRCYKNNFPGLHRLID